MHYNPRIHYTYGGELYHYRTVGSRNGYSKYSWYHPMGRKAIGRRLPNGTYEYTDTDTGTSQKNLEFRKMMRTSDENRLRKGNLQREADIRNAAQTREQKRLNQDKVNRQSKNLQNKLVSTTKANRDARLSSGAAKREADMRNANQNNSLRIASDRQAQKNNRFNNSFIGKALSKAQRAGNWLTERFGSAKTAVGNAARNAYNAISNQDEREAYERARDNLKKNNSAENRKAYDEAKSAYQNHALTKAGRAINDARNSVGLAARNTVTNARNTATRIAKEAPGNIERVLKDARTSIGKAWDGKAGNGSAKEDQKAYSRYGQRAAKAGNRKDVDKWAKAASASGQDYQKSIKGTAERLAKNASETARNVGGRVSETAGRLAKNAGETARGVGSKVSETAKGVSEAATTAVNKTIATANYKKAERKLDSLEKKMQKAADKDVNSLEYQRAEREFYAYRDGEYRAAQREFNRYKNK